jgi:AraC-like DNA-binding protein
LDQFDGVQPIDARPTVLLRAANSLLSAAKLEHGGKMRNVDEPLPTSLSLASRLAAAALQKQGINYAPLAKRAGLPVDIPTRVPVVRQARFLEFASAELDDVLLGLHLAESAEPREVGLVFYAASAAGTVRDALALLARYHRAVNDGIRLRIVAGGTRAKVEVDFARLRRHQARQITEFGVALTIRALREMAGSRICPTQVKWTHSRNAELSSFDAFFGCECAFGATEDCIEFDSSALDVSLISKDPHLLETLKPFCEEASTSRATTPGTFRDLVEQEITRSLPQRRASIKEVARRLAVSERTLARRLASEEVTFASVLDEVRHSLAVQYVREPGMTLSQTAWLLGYAETTSFNHAFKRWTGKTPTGHRKAIASSRPASSMRR